MADVHQLPDRNKLEQEASEWIARLESEDVTAADRSRFDAWRSADPRNALMFAEVSATWGRFLKAGRAVKRAAVPEAVGSRSRQRAHRGVKLAAAAAVVATLLAGIYLQNRPHLTTFTTSVGQQLTVPLSDGSFMELNSASEARVEYTHLQRTVHLDRGEAFFRVAHDTQRPFSVTAGEGWVRAVGTEFNVYLRSNSVQVTVREGTVKAGEGRASLAAVEPDEQALQAWVTLSQGQQADLDASAARKRTLSSEELADAVAWRSGTVYFENQPLAAVVGELNRYSAQPVIVEDEALRALPVGGAFQAGPNGGAALVRMLEQNFSVDVRRDAAGIHLRYVSQEARH